jgi:hypothetical protein
VRTAWIYAAAALLVATLLCWAMWPKHAATVQPGMAIDHGRPRESGDERRPDERVARVPDPKTPDPRMLAQLDVLDNMELLMNPDVDVLLATSYPATDEVLLDFQEDG